MPYSFLPRIRRVSRAKGCTTHVWSNGTIHPTQVTIDPLQEMYRQTSRRNCSLHSQCRQGKFMQKVSNRTVLRPDPISFIVNRTVLRPDPVSLLASFLGFLAGHSLGFLLTLAFHSLFYGVSSSGNVPNALRSVVDASCANNSCTIFSCPPHLA